MQAINSNVGGGTNPKSTNPRANPPPKGDIKSRSTTKKSVIGVSNISVSIRSSKKATDSSKTKNTVQSTNSVEASNSEKGIQVDEVEIIANDCTRIGENVGDAPIIRLPSPKIIKEIEKIRQQKKDMQLRARVNETRKFEQHSAKEEIHLNNLKEFLDTGAITRKREVIPVPNRIPEKNDESTDKTKNAVEAIDRVKQREEELINLFNSF